MDSDISTSTQLSSLLAKLPDDPKPEDYLALASSLSSEALPMMVVELARRGIDPTITTRGLLDVSDFLLKLVNSQKKKEDLPAGPGFSITVVLPGAKEEHIVFDQPPTQANTLVAWEDAPEF